jgi:hypothetical protein
MGGFDSALFDVDVFDADPAVTAAASFSALASIASAGESVEIIEAAASFSALAGVSVAGAIRSPSILLPTGSRDTLSLMPTGRDQR